MATIPLNKLVAGDGKCWRHKGKYLGKYLSVELFRRSFDTDVKYIFENDALYDYEFDLKVSEVPCVKVGGTRKNKRRIFRKRNNRSKRKLYSSG